MKRSLAHSSVVTCGDFAVEAKLELKESEGKVGCWCGDLPPAGGGVGPTQRRNGESPPSEASRLAATAVP